MAVWLWRRDTARRARARAGAVSQASRRALRDCCVVLIVCVAFAFGEQGRRDQRRVRSGVGSSVVELVCVEETGAGRSSFRHERGGGRLLQKPALLLLLRRQRPRSCNNNNNLNSDHSRRPSTHAQSQTHTAQQSPVHPPRASNASLRRPHPSSSPFARARSRRTPARADHLSAYLSRDTARARLSARARRAHDTRVSAAASRRRRRRRARRALSAATSQHNAGLPWPAWCRRRAGPLATGHRHPLHLRQLRRRGQAQAFRAHRLPQLRLSHLGQEAHQPRRAV